MDAEDTHSVGRHCPLFCEPTLPPGKGEGGAGVDETSAGRAAHHVKTEMDRPAGGMAAFDVVQSPPRHAAGRITYYL